MAGKGAGSYYEEYMRSNAMLKHGGERNAKQLLTDRNAYISFLEVQLERVSSACMAAQSFERRLAEVEAAQLASDQKISSLSKVFRLNQEYVDQTSEQSRSELASFASRMDSWMEKYSTQLQAHELRLTHSEELARRADTCIQTISDDLQRDVSELKSVVDADVQELKALVLAMDSRLEGVHNTDEHVDMLHKVLADRLSEDMERMRMSLSEKYVTMEQKHDELRECLHAFAAEIELNSKAELSRSARADDEHWRRMRDRLDAIERDSSSEIYDVKELLRKSLDAQHLLSATIVGLQTEIDESRMNGNPQGSRSLARQDTSFLTDAIEELQANQHHLKDALRVVQSCTREAEQRMEAQSDRLQERIELVEEQFGRLMLESTSNADELRSRVLTALGEVEQKLRQDADAVAENALESVRAESKQYISRFLEISTRLEERLEELEAAFESREGTRFHIRVPTMLEPKKDKIDPTSDSITASLEEKLSLIVSAVQQEARDRSAHQDELHERMRLIQDRLDTVTSSRRSSIVRKGSAADRKQSSVRPEELPGATSAKQSTSKVDALKTTRRTGTSDKAKATRLKELCLELVEMEGSLKQAAKRSAKKK